jgi:hypothetical protein
MKFSNDYSYYSGTGQPAATQVDEWSAASHEFGHASGRYGGSGTTAGHFVESDRACPDNVDDRSTMCPTTTFGTTAERSLESHDATSFDAVPGYN